MLISADAAQLEWRTAVELSGDQIGLTEIRDKQDTHSLNQVAFGLPSRLIAKIYLFRTIFRGSGFAFARDADFAHVSSSPQFWDNINERFYTKYSGLDGWHKSLSKLVMENKPIVGVMGRQWTINIPRDKMGNIKVPWTQLTNYPVQGTGADVMKLARIMFYRRIKQRNIKCDFITTVHDSICVDAESKWLPEIAAVFHEVFADLPNQIKNIFGYTWTVPLECEIKFGNNMKDMSKYT